MNGASSNSFLRMTFGRWSKSSILEVLFPCVTVSRCLTLHSWSSSFLTSQPKYSHMVSHQKYGRRCLRLYSGKGYCTPNFNGQFDTANMQWQFTVAICDNQIFCMSMSLLLLAHLMSRSFSTSSW